MARAVDGTRRRRRRKKILHQARGYRGARSKLFKTGKEAVTRALVYAYRDRRHKKRFFRALWITRISAGCRQHNLSYSRFMQGLKLAEVALNRKALSNMAIEDPAAFAELVKTSNEMLAGQR